MSVDKYSYNFYMDLAQMFDKILSKIKKVSESFCRSSFVDSPFLVSFPIVNTAQWRRSVI